MTRPTKATVDYFPHSCNHKKTMYILENKYKNDGYAFWFKLLEILGNTNGHSYDCNIKSNWEFLLAKTLVSEDIANDIMSTLSELEAIDKEIWEHKIVWCQNFIDGIEDVYKRRCVDLPIRDELMSTLIPIKRVSDNNNPQSKVKESKVKESKVKKSKDTCVCPHQKIIELYHKICPMLPKVVEWSATRQSYLKTRWNENIERQNLDWWEQYFIKVSNSDFLTGKKNDFMANLEWLVRPTNFIKVLEGNFNSREKGAVKTQAQKNIENANEWLQEKLAQQEQEKKDA